MQGYDDTAAAAVCEHKRYEKLVRMDEFACFSSSSLRGG